MPPKLPPMTTLKALLDEENALVISANDRLGSFVPLATRGRSLFFDAVSSIGRDHFIIALLMMAMQKTATLAFLSYLRKHVTQAEFNCRQLIEFCSITAYLIAHPEAELADPLADNLLTLDKSKSLSSKAYKWLKVAQPENSASLLEYKNMINDTVSHANLYVGNFTFELNSSGDNSLFEGTFFDRVDDDVIRLHLLSFGHLNLLIIRTIREASSLQQPITFVKDIEEILTQFERDLLAHQHALGKKMELDDLE